MKITKYDQSCVIIEKNNRKMVIDPVEFITKIPVASDVDVILVTHSHGDHLTPEVLSEFVKMNPDVTVLTAEDNMNIGATKSVKNGDRLTIGEFEMEFYGKNHASIVPGEVPCENVGVIINDTIIHPGDSYDIPPSNAKILLTPVSAPWIKTYETMQYIEEVEPEVVIPIHDALFSEVGRNINGNWLKKSCDKIGAEYKELLPEDSMEIDND